MSESVLYTLYWRLGINLGLTFLCLEKVKSYKASLTGKLPTWVSGAINTADRLPLLRGFHEPRTTALAAHRVGNQNKRSSDNKNVLLAAGSQGE